MKRPNKLCAGDEIRIIAPSRSMEILGDQGVKKAVHNLEKLGFQVTFGKHVKMCDLQNSSSIEHRLADLHEAFEDPNVKGILTVIGGFNSNELLPYIDYRLLERNPKVLCGYSDITAIANAITANCGFITYSGPHFSSFQMEGLQDEQTFYFTNCLMQEEPFEILPSEKWSDDLWFLDEENRQYYNTEWKVYTPGTVEGPLIGGNLCTLNLLQGTQYMPKTEGAILFIEDDELTRPELFARDLTSLFQAAGLIKGLLIGRFQNDSDMSEEQLLFILNKYPFLQEIPVLYNLDFGHTQPICTLPIGGTVKVDTQSRRIQLIKF